MVHNQYKCAIQLVVFFLFATLPVLSTDLQNEVIRLNNDGVKLLNEASFEDSIKELEKAISLDSSYQLAKDNLVIAKDKLESLKAAKECEKTGKYKEAVGFYSQLMEPDIFYPAGRAKFMHMRALAKQKAGDVNGARADFKQEEVDLLEQKSWNKDQGVSEKDQPSGK